MIKIFTTFALSLMSAPSLAHHPLDGMPMITFAQGLLSGIGHPFLGYDHLFFVLLVGLAAAFTQPRKLAPAAYIVAMLAGCLLTTLWRSLPATEIMVAASLLVLGGILLSGRGIGLNATLAIFAGFGLFHGSAFGEALATQESGFAVPVLIGYLIGLGLTQYVLALSATWLSYDIWKVRQANAIQPRLASAAIAGMGLMMSLEQFGVGY